MKKSVQLFSRLYIGLSTLSLLSVSLMTLVNPQDTMDLVATTLDNTDAMSSIRGIYGGGGFAIVVSLVYLMIKDIPKALKFLALFWGGYAFSRMLTIWIDGELGDFGTQWLVVESVLFAVGLLLVLVSKPREQKNV